jgi:hypothetical protein
MNTRATLRLAVAALLALASSVAGVACSGDNSGNPGPTPHDSGTQQDTSMGMDVQQSNDSPSSHDSPTGNDAGDAGTDSSNPNCTSDAMICNSCVTPQQDPYNACSTATTNCIPFDKTRVPSHPML